MSGDLSMMQGDLMKLKRLKCGSTALAFVAGAWLGLAGPITSQAASIRARATAPGTDPRNLSLYERTVAQRNANPTRFDRMHPMWGKLISNQNFYESMVARLTLNPGRFEFYHPTFWRLVDGAMQYNQQPQVLEPPAGGSDGGSSGQEGENPPPGGDDGGNPPPGGDNGGGDPDPGPTPTPEPSSLLMIVTALVVGGGISVARRSGLRVRPITG
jgi:hypothetical protein